MSSQHEILPLIDQYTQDSAYQALHRESAMADYLETKIKLATIISIIFFGVLVFGKGSFAATIQIGSPWTVSTINAAIAAANDGDIIELTGSGTVTWTQTVTIPNTKGITLTVAGGTNTPKNAANFPIVVTSTQDPVIQLNIGINNSLTRISGFKFKGGNQSSTFIQVVGHGLGKSPYNGAYRIDNNYFDVTGEVIMLNGASGELTGLTDNCTFHDSGADIYVIRIWGDGSGPCYGQDSWARPFSFGDSHFHFIEDNLFENVTRCARHYVSSDGAGGRYVVRHNTFNATYACGMDYIDAHGDGTQGLGIGARGGEICGNTFLGTDTGVGRNINIRGGQWLIYDNTFTSLGWGSAPMHFTDYRAWQATCSGQVQYPSPCTPGIPQCATPADFATWYPLPGQVHGTYVWNNAYSGSSRAPFVIPDNYVPTYIQPNRDYWVATNLADAKSKGLSAGYMAYSYPHPLRAEIDTTPPSAPRGLVIK